ncbi:MAG: NADH-quinone oxidoreductase subunit NuoK [Candidatus Bathyarchaeia archaeon]
MVSIEYYLGTIVILYVLGLYCLASKRNMIKLLIAIAILGNAVNLSFISLSAHMYPASDPLASSVVIMLIVIEACIAAVGLSITIWAYRHYKTLDVRQLSRLKW